MSLIEPSVFRGQHARYSPSKVTWIRYDKESCIEAFHNENRKAIGTYIHFWSGIQIQLRQKCSSLRDISKSVRTLIFSENFSERYGLSDTGKVLINEMVQIPSEVFSTVKAYVNDSISFMMEPEKELIFTEDVAGTCDSFSFDKKDRTLKIFDLKTGRQRAKPEQVLIYAAIWCLKENYDPNDISYDFRIYQNDEVLFVNPEPDEIKAIMKQCNFVNDISEELQKGGIV